MALLKLCTIHLTARRSQDSRRFDHVCRHVHTTWKLDITSFKLHREAFSYVFDHHTVLRPHKGRIQSSLVDTQVKNASYEPMSLRLRRPHRAPLRAHETPPSEAVQEDCATRTLFRLDSAMLDGTVPQPIQR
jgi:hypothetical protein